MAHAFHLVRDAAVDVIVAPKGVAEVYLKTAAGHRLRIAHITGGYDAQAAN